MRRVHDLSWLAGALLVTVALRFLVARGHAVELADAEEFLNLRLARQVLAGLPVRDLHSFWFSAGPGPNGGPLATSVMAVPFVAVLGPGTAALRLMATLWAIAAALLVGATVARLSRSSSCLPGVAATLVLPPAWAVFSSTSKGNHVEGAILALACCLALLRFLDQPMRRRAATLALCSCFSAWYADVAVLPALLALLVGLWRRRDPWLVAGLLAAGALLTTGRSGGPVADVLGFAPDGIRWLRYEPGRLFDLLRLSYLDVPGFDTLLLGPGAHLGPDWQAAQRVLNGIHWSVTAWAVSWLHRRSQHGIRGVAPLLVTAMLLPVAFALLGVGPDSIDGLGVARTYFWEPRRLAIVHLLWAVAYGVLLASATTAGGWRRALWLLPLGGVALSLVFLLPAEAAPPEFHPEAYMLCPAAEPEQELDVCVPRLLPGDPESLQVLLAEPEIAGAPAARAALEGWASVEGAADSCRLLERDLPEPSIRSSEPYWHGVAAAGRRRCAGEASSRLCLEAPSGPLRALCLRSQVLR